MAHPTEKSKRLAELVSRSEESRIVLSEAHARLQHALDVPARIKSSVASSPAKWLGGSLVAGIAANFLFRRGKRRDRTDAAPEKKQRGLVLGLLTMLFTLSKPALKIYAANLLRDYLSSRFLTGAMDRPAILRKPPY